MISIAEVSIRLMVATILGGVLGFEREISNRPAGLRTHILVTLGSCLIMVLSVYGFEGRGVDGAGGEPARLAAQVVSGIGFLGAGTILREGTNVRGLTTAASIWICGGIGLAVGLGFYFAAFGTTALALFSLLILKTVETKMSKMKKFSEVKIRGLGKPGLIGEIGTIFGRHQVSIKNIIVDQRDYSDQEYEENLEIIFIIRLPRDFNKIACVGELKRLDGVYSIEWNGQEVLNSPGF